MWTGSPSSVCETLGNADIWLIRTFWDIETPRPTPPNFRYVGGLHCKPANQLPDDMEAFVQSSGDAGVVVVSFGSMVTNLMPERADVIAAAFGRIPQKVRGSTHSEKHAFRDIRKSQCSTALIVTRCTFVFNVESDEGMCSRLVVLPVERTSCLWSGNLEVPRRNS